MLFQQQGGRPGNPQADQPADQADAGRLDQKLQQDGSPFGADGLADADLPRPFGHGDKHDVHDADPADEEGQAGDKEADRGDDPGHPVHHVQELVLLVDGEIVRVAGREMTDWRITACNSSSPRPGRPRVTFT